MLRTATRGLAALAAAALIGGIASTASHDRTALAQSDLPERIDTGKACYVRLPDLPAGRYGGFGAYNPDTGVLAYAGGAEKFGDNETRTHSDMYAFKLDGTKKAWQNVPYSGGVGYNSSASDKGCREMVSVPTTWSNWLSVFGKDGCDNGNVDTSKKSGGDIKELTVGDSASASGVRWVTNSGVNALPVGTDLQINKGKLVRLFAAWDSQRSRVVFGQGTFNDEIEGESQDEVYTASKSGSKWNVQQLNVGGGKPTRRLGSCAAYVYNKDTGADGLIVLGGHTGGLSGASGFNEVWWMDFAKNRSGVWQEITSRISNQGAPDADGLSMGFRREGACAYDPETKFFYSWFGRGDSKIKDGASHSTGLWRLSLANVHDAASPLAWERLSPDNLEKATSGKILGRRLIPGVWDPKNKRFFVIGGRGGKDGLEALSDAWVLYPDVTGEACATLDIYSPFRPGNPTPTTPPASATTPSGGTPATPTPVRPTAVPPTPSGEVLPCPQLESRAPAAALAQALSMATSLSGYGMACNPNVPLSPVNPLRTHVTLRNVNLPYHPLYNGFVLRCGCQ